MRKIKHKKKSEGKKKEKRNKKKAGDQTQTSQSAATQRNSGGGPGGAAGKWGQPSSLAQSGIIFTLCGGIKIEIWRNIYAHKKESCIAHKHLVSIQQKKS